MSLRRQNGSWTPVRDSGARRSASTVSTSRTRQWGAWPPTAARGGGAAENARGGSLNALDLLDDPDELPDFPQTEAELVQHYHSSIMEQQQRHLEPLREDLADWLNKILDLDYLTSSNFMDMLDTGVLVCHLARIIQSKAKDVVVTRQHRHGVGEGISENVTISTTTTTISTSTTFFSRNGSISEAAPEGQQGGMKQAQQLLQALLRGTNNHANLLAAAKMVPQNKIRCWERAAKGSFFSRENACNFINFCRQLGIHDNLLFESEDLVLHGKPRNVILCLLELGRVAGRLGMEPPGLVQLEREVDLQIERYNCSLDQMTSDLLFINDHDENPKPNEPLTDPFDDGGAGDECQSAAKPFIEDEASRDEADNINNPVAHMNRSLTYSKMDFINDQSLDVKLNGCRGFSNCPTPADDELLSLNSELLSETSRSPVSPAPSSFTSASIKSNNISANSLIENCRQADEVSSLPSPTSSDSRVPFIRPIKNPSELDKKVELYVLKTQSECRCAEKYCDRLRIYKISEGLYRIGDRNVFIRLFKDRHVMVRVGGGWDTLEHYLIRHDPCRRGHDSSLSRSPTPEINFPSRHRLSNGSTVPVLTTSTPCLSHESEGMNGRGKTPEKLFQASSTGTSTGGWGGALATTTSSNTNRRPRYVGRSLTMDLNHQINSHFNSESSNETAVITSRRSSSSNSNNSFVTQTKLSTLAKGFRDGSLSPSTPEPSRMSGSGFNFSRSISARPSVLTSRQSSFNNGSASSVKRSRPAPVYNRSRTTDLSDLARRTSALISPSLR